GAISGHNTTVERTFWFTKVQNKEPVDLRTDSDYTGRVQYHCAENSCTLIITDLRESDSAVYKFRFITNQDGGCFIGSPGVTVPSGQIVEGSSVTLTCSSDANPAAKYTWYKENGHQQSQLFIRKSQLVFRSIQPSDSGEYFCVVENNLGMRTSRYIFIDVTYPPKLPSVSVSPSGQIVEGSSVTLTCSTDANPAAKYTWYKENDHKYHSQGPQLVFSSIQSSDSGQYYCAAENNLGMRTSQYIFIENTQQQQPEKESGSSSHFMADIQWWKKVFRHPIHL
uniref:Ig-like domain-containing protein n=1 Tax=Lates calcarifer TaxID=8187 RepID=A0A4W6EME2_LATCA